MVNSIALGLLAGTLAVFVFNKIPPKWLADYGEEPTEEAWGKRLKEAYFIPLLSSFFIWVAHTMRNQETDLMLAGFLAIWLLVLISIADYKFMIIPDQFTIGLALVSIGVIPYQASMLSPLLGALVGAGFFFLIGLIGQMIFKKDAMGFGDVKLMGAIGLIGGFQGTLMILFLAIMSSGLILGAMLVAGKVKRDEAKPLGPFIAAAATVYILFKAQLLMALDFYLGLF